MFFDLTFTKDAGSIDKQNIFKRNLTTRLCVFTYEPAAYVNTLEDQ